MTANWIDLLNPAQRQAAMHGDGPLLVVAGAGTGKTRTLAARVAWLIERGVAPDRILLLTFTRRAAAEMLRRARSMCGRPEAQRVWGGTFHSVANRLLRTYGRAVGLSPDFTVMDEADAADLLNLIRAELGLDKTERRFPRKQTLLAIYSRTVNAEENLGNVLERFYPWCRGDHEAIAALFEHYRRRKRAQHLLDYDDLLLYWQALCEDERLGPRVAQRFEHILVDEYQDTNRLQARILIALGRYVRNIMVVGDDAQSIYSFRAATVHNMLEFPGQFPGTRVVKLEQNYRSTQPILDACNAVMDEARQRFTKRLWSERRDGVRPQLIACLDESEQSDAVCRRILEHREQGIPLHRQAVLFRAGFHSAQLEIVLQRCNIPFHKYGGLRFLEMAHIKDALAVLRILQNPYDQTSWLRVLTLFEGIGPRIAQRIMQWLGVLPNEPEPASPTPEAPRRGLGPLLRLVDDPPRIPPSAQRAFDELRALVRECRPLAEAANNNEEDTAASRSTPPVAAQVERVRRFYAPLAKRKFDDWAVRLRDLEQLEQIAVRYRSRSRFLTDLTLDPPSSTSDLAGRPRRDDDYLVLSTIHSAKGLEWDVVHIIHATDGMIPSDMATGSEDEIEEERRMFYVALTRARERLYVYFPLRYYRHRFGTGDDHGLAQISRFLTDRVLRCFDCRPISAAAQAEPNTTLRDEMDARLTRLWRSG